MPPSGSMATRRGPSAPRCSQTDEEPGPPLKEKVRGRASGPLARSAAYAMKKMRASVSPSLFFRGRTPVVTEYLRTRPGSRSSWRVVTGFSSSSFSFLSLSFALSASAEGGADGVGTAACSSRNEARARIMRSPFREWALYPGPVRTGKVTRPQLYSSCMRRTKIVATIGPASRDARTLESLIEAGVDVLRLNFSHGDHPQHLEVIGLAREIARRRGRAIALLQDLSGPKIRTGRVRDPEGIELRDGARVTITTDESVVGTPALISTTYDPLPRDVKPEDRVLLDDGNLELRVVETGETTVECVVVHGGRLKSNKGMNLPGAKLSTPALTDKDRRDLAFGVANGVDYVALSFVRQPADVVEAKALVAAQGAKTPVIAKIEKREAVDQLAAILAVADGLMVARGDLGVELSTEEVPTLQKQIIEAANAAGKVVITATQMLESMIENARPTRAEASDVANAILDGTDAVMLSAETAAGRFPVAAVETMARIAGYTEKHLSLHRSPVRRRSAPTDRVTPMVARSLARVAATVAEELDCRLIVAFTESGSTARLVSSFRPGAPIVAITRHETNYRELALWWGVVPLYSGALENTTDDMVLRAQALLKERGLVREGDTILMLAGQSHTAGATNMLRVHSIT